MLNTPNNIGNNPRRAMTLVELLVVAMILVLFVAVAAPLMKPATADRKVREAARQINALLAEAQTYAAQRGKPYGLAFDRAAASREGARDSNIISRCYFAEVPPRYTGDFGPPNASRVVLWREPTQPFIPNYTPPPINGNAAKMITLEFQFNGTLENAGLNSLVGNYIGSPTPGSTLPFTIKFGGDTSYYSGVAVYGNTPPPGIQGRQYNYFCWAPQGTNVFSASIPDLPPPPYPSIDPMNPPAFVANSFEIAFPPVPVPGSMLELPTGTVVDLQFSGYGIAGTQFLDKNRTATLPLVVLFNPAGDISAIQDRTSWGEPQGRMHFLVGTLNKAVDSLDANTGNVNLPISNLSDTANQWISISTRTGHVITSDNASSANLNAPTVGEARTLATTLNTKGGR